MNQSNRNRFFDKIIQISTHGSPWLWLVIGLCLLPFTAWQTVIPLAAWLAPMFLLRFVRTTDKTRMALLLVTLAYAVSILIAMRGMFSNDMLFNIVLLIVMPLFRSVVYSLPYRADRMLGSRLGPWGRMLIFPLAFITVDWVMSLLPAITTAGSPAYSQIGDLPLMQVLSITGMWGLTFLITWFASTANALWEHDFDWRPVRTQVGLFSGVLLAVFLFGVLRLSSTPPAALTVKAATITIDSAVYNAASSAINWQTFNASNDAERSTIRPKFQATVDQMLARTETALRGGARIVGWQEAAAMVLAEDKALVLDRASSVAKQYGAELQLSLEVFTRAETLPYIHNESVLIDDTGRILWSYDKTHPTIGEDTVTIAGLGKLPVADTAYGRLSTAICNDMAFPPLLRQAGRNGIDILIAPTSDNRFIDQHIMAISRAIENGFSLVRPTGSSISVITDYQGRILGRQDYFADSTGILLSSLPIQGVATVYSRIGDLFAYLCVAGMVFLTGWVLLHRKHPARAIQNQPST